MNGKYIVALDQGTSSCRAILVSQQGDIVAIEQEEFTQHFPKAGWVEHDAEEIWEVQLKMFRQLLHNQGIQAGDVLGIGITNQRETTVVWNKHTGQPIHKAIVWQDRRTAPICEDIKQSGHDGYIYENTGLVVDAYFSGTKVKWILDNVPDARAMAAKGDLCFGTMDSWLIWKMTNGKSHVTDYTNASRTMLYNIRTLEWDPKILDLIEVPAGILPRVQPSASEFGLFEIDDVSIPICGVAGDQQSALFGQACFSAGMAKNTYGTGCFLLMNVGKEFVQSKNGLLTTLCCDANGQVCYGLEGSIFIAGAAIQWLRDGLQVIESSPDSENIASAVADNHDVVVVPAFAGLGAPYWNMYARGAIFGLTRGTERSHLIKGTLDSLAYQTRDVIDAMAEDAGQPLEMLKVDGGACANSYLMQFQADILGTPVERPEVIETTAMGAAYLAGITLGLWNSELIESNRKVDRVFKSTMSEEERKSLYTQWKKAVERTLDWVDA
ncbi:MAG: glycerol kinase GlpK [Saprospiraceae bacterium]|nr:glycerol kinase GlpK [Saprospiraceae bacterium]